mgnify:CR=1 FL=1
MIKITNLTKSYNDLTVLKGVNLEIKQGEVVSIVGASGAGKTTFIKAVCQILGVKEVVSSPTFALINEYEGNYDNQNTKLIYHCDFYRINNPNEVLELGIEEYFEKAEVDQRLEEILIAEAEICKGLPIKAVLH